MGYSANAGPMAARPLRPTRNERKHTSIYNQPTLIRKENIMLDTAIFGAAVLSLGLTVAGVLMTAREFQRLDKQNG